MEHWSLLISCPPMNYVLRKELIWYISVHLILICIHFSSNVRLITTFRISYLTLTSHRNPTQTRLGFNYLISTEVLIFGRGISLFNLKGFTILLTHITSTCITLISIIIIFILQIQNKKTSTNFPFWLLKTLQDNKNWINYTIFLPRRERRKGEKEGDIYIQYLSKIGRGERERDSQMQFQILY